MKGRLPRGAKKLMLPCFLAAIAFGSTNCSPEVSFVEFHEPKRMVEPFKKLQHPEDTRTVRYLSLSNRYLGHKRNGHPHKAIIWDTRSGTISHRFPTHGASTFSPTGDYYAIRMPSGIKIYRSGHWDAEIQLHPYPEEKSAILGVEFSADEQWLAVAGISRDDSFGGWIDLYRFPEGNLITKVKTLFQPFDIELSPDGATLVVSSLGILSSMDLFDTATGDRLFSLAAGFPEQLLMVGEIYDLSSSPAGRWLATAHSGSTVRIWDLRSRSQAECYQFPQAGRQGRVAFSPDGRFLVAAVLRHLAVWQLDGDEWELVSLFKGRFRSDWGLAFSPDGEFLAMGQYDSAEKAYGAGSSYEVHTDYIAVHRFEQLIQDSP